jgi:hypothetical protein
MAKKGDPIGFTVGDQENIAESRVLLESLVDHMSELPCAQKPPQCTQETRLSSLEGTRKKTTAGYLTAVISIIVGVVVYIFRLVAGAP